MIKEGVVTIASASSPLETTKRLLTEIVEAHMTVFARIDHRAAAKEVGLEMPHTEVIVFGNAKAGTGLMLAAPTLGIDLPLKMLVWCDAVGRTWLSYNDPSWLVRRHGVTQDETGIVAKMSDLLSAIASKAVV